MLLVIEVRQMRKHKIRVVLADDGDRPCRLLFVSARIGGKLYIQLVLEIGGMHLLIRRKLHLFRLTKLRNQVVDRRTDRYPASQLPP